MVLKKWSLREYEARKAWLDDQWNEPSRSDYYLMQIAQAFIGTKDINKLKLPFVFKKEGETEDPIEAEKEYLAKTVEQRTQKSKSFWGGLISKATLRWKTKDGTILDEHDGTGTPPS